MGKLINFITLQHYLQLKCFLLNRLQYLIGFTTIKNILLVCFYQKLLK